MKENYQIILNKTIDEIQKNNTVPSCFAITEPFILQIFQDFLTDMDSDVYYTPDEAVAIIDRMIRQMEAK